MGSLCGGIFGALDVEDKGNSDIDINFMEGSSFFIPISFLLGLVAGTLNEYLRMKVTYI
jgi:hypothetical protein